MSEKYFMDVDKIAILETCFNLYGKKIVEDCEEFASQLELDDNETRSALILLSCLKMDLVKRFQIEVDIEFGIEKFLDRLNEFVCTVTDIITPQVQGGKCDRSTYARGLANKILLGINYIRESLVEVGLFPVRAS